MAAFNVINDIFEYCAKKHIEFELNLEENNNRLQYESDKKKVTLFLSDQRDDNTESFIISEFMKLKELID